MTRTASRVSQLSRWAADPARMARFVAVAVLCQRTSFVKSILCLDDPESLIRSQVKAVCQLNGVKCVLQRGNSFSWIHGKSLTSIQRYHASFLVNTFNATNSGGLVLSDGIRSDDVLEKLLFSYHRYLTTFQRTAAEAEVSFEKFVFVRESCLIGEVDMMLCDNCESEYVNLRVYSYQCPFCVMHNHAVRKRRPGRLTSPVQCAPRAGMSG